MKNIYLILLLALMASCVRPQEKLQQEITEKEKAFKETGTIAPSAGQADTLVKLYIDYANQYQDDTLSPEYLFRAGDLSIGLQKFTEAQELLARVQRYPNYAKLPQVTFLQGFVAENHMGDITAAKKYYETFLDKYPNHPLAKDARAAIDHLGMSPEELIKMFEQNMQDSTATR